MRKILALLLLAFAGLASAQQATLTTPVSRTSEDHYQVAELNIRSGAGGQTPQVLITVSVQDSGGNEIRRFNCVIPDATHLGATIAGYITSQMFTVHAGETGPNPQKANFRAIDYLQTQGYFPPVNLVP